jgi:hypothetical protein
MGSSPDADRGDDFVPFKRQIAVLARESGHDFGNHEGRGLRAVLEGLLDEGRRKAPGARLQGCDGLSGSQ